MMYPFSQIQFTQFVHRNIVYICVFAAIVCIEFAKIYGRTYITILTQTKPNQRKIETAIILRMHIEWAHNTVVAPYNSNTSSSTIQ